MTLRLVCIGTAALTVAPTLARADWPQLLQMTPSAYSLHSTVDGAGGAYFAWSENSAVRVLRIATSGGPAAGWPASGLLVHGDGGIDVRTAKGPSDGIYLGWWKYGAGAWLQRLDADGQVAQGWPSGGWSFSSVTDPWGAHPVFDLAPDGQGGVYVVWSKDDFIRVTRIQPGGTPYPGWLAGGKVVTSANVHFAWTPDGAGGAFFAYTGGDRINVQQRDPAGALVGAWQSDLLGAAAGNDPKYLIRVAPDGAGGVVVAWSWAQWVNDVSQTALTRLLADCTPAPGWPAGGGWKSLDPSESGCATSVHVDESGSIFLPWVSASNWGTGEIRVTRWLPDGSLPPGWTESGVPLPGAVENCGYVESNGNFPLPSFLPDDAGGLYYSYLSPAYELKINRINAQGAVDVSWPAQGVLLRSGITQRDLALIPDGAGGATASWRVFEANAAEAQHVNPDGTLGPAPVVDVATPAGPGMLSFSLPRPNPAHHAVAFSLELAEPTPARVAVFDPQGRLVRRIAGGQVLSPGVHEFRWNLEDGSDHRVRPGVYLVRAVAGAATITRSLIVTE